MTQETEQNEPPSLEIVFTEVKNRLNAQSDQIRSLDEKIALVLSSSSLIITIGAGLRTALGKSGPGAVTLPSTNICGLILFGLAAVLYLMTITFAFKAYRPGPYRRDPEPRALRERYMSKDAVFTKRKILANMIQSFEENEKRIYHNKVRPLKRALKLLMFETIALVAALILPPFMAALTPSFTRVIIFVVQCLIAALTKG